MKYTYKRIIALFVFTLPVFVSSQWQTYNTPVNCNYWAVSVVNSSVIWAVGDLPGTIIKTTDGGASWINSDNGLDDTMGVYLICAIDANTAWVAAGRNWSRLFKTTSGGQSWTELTYPRQNFINKIRFFNANTGVMFVDHAIPPYADTCNYLVTRDGGSNWYRPPNAPVILVFTNDQINIMDTSFITFTAAPDNGTQKKFYRLQSGLDAQWEVFALPSNYPAFVFFKDHNTGLGTGLVDSIYKTTNAGASWYRIAGGGFGTWSGMNVPGTNWAVIYGSTEILFSRDFGVSFQTTSVSTSTFRYGDTKDTNSMWISGVGGKLYKYNIAFIGIQQISSEVPESFILQQNYPNPFNPETRIRFELPNSADIAFKVFDVTGRELYNLTEPGKHPGKYEIFFNGNNLASGIYYYSLSDGSLIQTHKMILLK